MKKKGILLLWITLLGVLGLSAQSPAPTTLEGWAERLQKFGKAIPQEQVFIHMDNTCYFLGDTLYFKAYVRRTDTGAPSQLSGVLYADLFNQDGYLVQRQQLELSHGQVHGSFVLQDTLYGGFYELRAYTRWQLNWGAYERPHTKFSEEWFFNKRMAREYYRDYEKLYSRVFPVYDKPKVPGDFVHDMTLRPLRRYFKADNESKEGKIQLFPEGGHLVADVPNRIAFEANSAEGMRVEGKVEILDAGGNKVTEATTEQRGRGTVEFTPQSGNKYTARLTWKKGTANAMLPQVETDGCAMKVTQQEGKIQLRISATGGAATENLGLTVMNQGVLLDFRELGTGSSLTATLEEAKLQSGVCQLTIFNAQGRIYADRLVFVRKNEPSAQQLQFSGIGTTNIAPLSSVKIGVEGGSANSNISLAIRDAAHTEYIFDDGNIMTEMLLSSQIRGFVENPGYFFEADDAEHRRALDLLLMIQGWRRFDWKVMATPGAFELNHMPEQTPFYTGEVYNYQAARAEDEFQITDKDLTPSDDQEKQNQSGKGQNDEPGKSEGRKNEAQQNNNTPNGDEIQGARDRFRQKETNLKRELLVHAEFTKPGAPEGVVGEMQTKKGTFSLQSPRFYEGCYLFLAAADTSKWEPGAVEKHMWIAKGEDAEGQPIYPDYYVRLQPFHPRFVQPYDFYQARLAAVPKGSAMAQEWTTDGSRTLDQVVIGARRSGLNKFDATKPAFVIDAYDAFNAACDAGFCTAYFMGRHRFVQDVARTYIGDMNMERAYELEIRLNGKPEESFTSNQRYSTDYGKNSIVPSMPVSSTFMSSAEKQQFNELSRIGKVYVYTDYSPRREGDVRFDQSNQPTVEIDLRPIDEKGTQRDVMRDRRYVLAGFSAPEEFYQPDYSRQPLPDIKDYRRTLYWNPDLKLDENGQATVEFYNNSKPTQIAVSAEGMSADGTLMTGKSMPEDR